MNKLIILRGPSASGKSTIAALLADAMDNTAVLDFDIYRNTLLGKQGDYYPVSAEMLVTDTEICLKHGYNVVVDGFYRVDRFPNYLDDVLKAHPTENYIFYFDISFEETLRRHNTRPKALECSREQLLEWYYTPKPNSKYDFEHRIDENLSLEETLNYVLEKIQ